MRMGLLKNTAVPAGKLVWRFFKKQFYDNWSVFGAQHTAFVGGRQGGQKPDEEENKS